MKREGRASQGGGDGQPGGKAKRVTADVGGKKVNLPLGELDKLGGSLKVQVVLPPCQVNLVRCDPLVRQQQRRRHSHQQSDATATAGGGGENRWHCDQCSRHYGKKYRLTAHKKTHNDPNYLRCPICFKRYLSWHGLYYHRKKHTGLKPFRCTKCSAAFMTNDHLTKHMFYHSGERPFGCGVCGERYTSRSGLEYHVKTVARCRLGFEAYRVQEYPRVRFPCSKCRRSFVVEKDLANHMRYHGQRGGAVRS